MNQAKIDELLEKAGKLMEESGRDVAILITMPEDRYGWTVEVVSADRRGDVLATIAYAPDLTILGSEYDSPVRSLDEAVRLIEEERK